MSDRLLQGVRVIDLTRLLPGPYASLVLADLGADVIKVERPRYGDPLRYMARFGAESGAWLFDLVNRGKRSLTLNIRATEGRATLLDLLQGADVLVEGFRPGVMEGHGLGYGQVSAVYPHLVYASLSGYGQNGPYRLRAGHDVNYASLGGLIALTGARDGPPIIPGVPIADLVGALWTVIGVLAALFGRQRSGKGQHVDVAMMDSVAALLPVALADWLATGQVPERGNAPLTGKRACYSVYETADGKYMSLGALEPQFWRDFCSAVGRQDWAGRQNEAGQGDLIAEVAKLFRSQPRDYWVALLAAHDCCCEPVLSLDEVFRHPQAEYRCLFRDDRLETPVARTADQPPAPRLGEHTEVILTELGYGEGDIRRLRDIGAV